MHGSRRFPTALLKKGALRLCAVSSASSAMSYPAGGAAARWNKTAGIACPHSSSWSPDNEALVPDS